MVCPSPYPHRTRKCRVLRRVGLISTDRLTGLAIDEQAMSARVEAGMRWAEFIEEAGKVGVIALNGSSTTETVVSYTLGRGHGPFSRTYGYAADHVTALDVVTAGGALRHVTANIKLQQEIYFRVR